MANDHVIDVKVRADTTNLSKGLSDAEKQLGKAGAGFSKYGSEAEKASKQTQGFVEKNRGHMETVGKDAMIMGAGILAGVAVAVHAYSEFSSRMAQVQSLSHASAAEMDVLTKSALTVGTAFGLSANDVADAEIELVKAGVSVKEMMGGALPGALALAAAGQIDVGKATEIATIALTQFKLSGKDVPHVADLLAAGADKALGGVQELGDALKQGGLVASSFGLSLDDTIGTLSAFANAGLIGSDSGTSLKTMLIALANPAKQARDKMAELGISAFDANDKFVGITSLAGQLHDKLGPLADAQQKAALATIFGNDAIRAGKALMDEGSDGIRKWINDVNDQGFAAAQAAGKMNSLNGDFKKLQAAVETGLIQMGATADGFLRPVVQKVTDAIQAFNSMPDSVKGAGLAVAAVTGTGLLLGGMLLTVIPKVHDTIQAFKALEQASPRLAESIKGVGKASLIAAGLIAAMQVAQAIGKNFETAAKSTDEMAQSMLALNKSGAQASDVFGKDMFKSSNGRQFVQDLNGIGDAIKQVSQTDWVDNVNDFGNTLLGIVGLHKDTQLDKTRESIKNIDSAMANFVHSGSTEIAATNFKKIADEASKQGVNVETTAKSFPQYMDGLRKLASDMKVYLEPQELMNWALGQVPQKMLDAQNSTEGQAKMAEIAAKQTEAQQKALDDLGIAADGTILHLDRLVTSMIASGLISLSARDAARQFEASIDALDEAIKQNGTTLDTTTEKGRANEAAYDAISGAGLRNAEAMAKNGASQAEVQQALINTHDQLIIAAGKFDITGQAAEDMARDVMKIPKDVPIETAIKNYADTMAKAQAIRDAVNGITSRDIEINIRHRDSYEKRVVDSGGNEPGGGGLYGSDQGHAFGGAIYGRGPKGVDSVRTMLAPGEHVLTDADVDAMGGQEAVYAFRKQLHGGVRPMYAEKAPAAPAAIGGFASVPSGPSIGSITINDQSDPVSTWHELNRRVSRLGV